MTHSLHDPALDDVHRLDPGCSECCEKPIAELDDAHVRAIFGFGRAELTALLDPTGIRADGSLRRTDDLWLARALVVLRTCREAIRGANALRTEQYASALVREQRWPGDAEDKLPAIAGPRP